MVAGNEQFERRDEVEEVLPHETRCYLVTARHGFDLGLIPFPPLLCLLGDYQARAMQLCHVRWVALLIRGDEGAHISNRAIVAKDFENGIDKGRFAICPGAIGEDENMLICGAGTAIAHKALQKGLQLYITCRDAIEKGRPDRVRGARGRSGASGLLGDEASGVGAAARTVSQVECLCC